ncbi:hypothetical protein [Variovorax sp. ZT4R33]|uniref:hypothetical protein n=1 Tax=Variovorax sp. ZT4R33 TaxID=3443743 RepID=UPI003F482F40
MRHWLCVLLLTLLPIQFSWAAVTGYCTHEAGAQVRHLGHHQHAHGDPQGDAATSSSSQAADDDDGRASATVDPDCGHCHGLGVGLLMPVVAIPGPTAVHDGPPWTADAQGLRATAPPERPQWPPLA